MVTFVTICIYEDGLLPIISKMYIIVFRIFDNGSGIHGCPEKNNCISGVAGIELATVWL